MRSVAKHVQWVLGLQQCSLSHHTAAAAGLRPPTAPGAAPAHDRVAAQVADLQLQVGALAQMYQDLITAIGPGCAGDPVGLKVEQPDLQAVKQECKQE